MYLISGESLPDTSYHICPMHKHNLLDKPKSSRIIKYKNIDSSCCGFHMLKNSANSPKIEKICLPTVKQENYYHICVQICTAARTVKQVIERV